MCREAGWTPSGSRRYCRQHEHSCRDRQRIIWCDPKQQASQRWRYQERCSKSHRNSGGGPRQYVALNLNRDVPWTRPHRDSDPNLSRLLRHQEREHAIDADGHQLHSTAREERDQQCDKPRLLGKPSHPRLHGLDCHRQGRIRLAEFLADPMGQSRGIE